MQEGEPGGQAAGLTALARQEASCPGWLERVYALFGEWLKARGRQPFVIADFYKWAHNERDLPEPTEPRCWGGFVLDRRAAGMIERAPGTRYATPMHGHSAPRSQWRSTTGEPSKAEKRRDPWGFLKGLRK